MTTVKKGQLLPFYQIIFPENPTEHPKTKEEFDEKFEAAFTEVVKIIPSYTRTKFRRAVWNWASGREFWKSTFSEKSFADLIKESPEAIKTFTELWNADAHWKDIRDKMFISGKPVFPSSAKRHDVYDVANSLRLKDREQLRAEQAKATPPTQPSEPAPLPLQAQPLTPEQFRTKFRERIEQLLVGKRVIRNKELIYDPTLIELIGADKVLHERWERCKSEIYQMWSEGLLFMLQIGGENNHTFERYFSNKPGFYSAEELCSFIPEEERERVLGLTVEIVKSGTHSVAKLAAQFYPGQKAQSILAVLLPKLLEEYLELDVISVNDDGHYKKGALYEVGGGDLETIRVLKRIGQIIMGRLKEEKREFRTPEDILQARAESRKRLRTQSFQLEDIITLKGPINILFAGGMPSGHILTAEDFFWKVLQILQKHPELGPDIAIANNFVQGNFLFEDIMRGLTLDDFSGLDAIDRQIEAANVWLLQMQSLPRNKVLLVNESVDEKRTARNYALKQMLKGQQWGKVFGLNLSIEQQRYAKNKFFFHLIRFQVEVIVAYWLRIGRAPWNQGQMDAYAQANNLPMLRQSEDIAIVNIVWAEKFGNEKNYPNLSPDDQNLVDKLRKRYGKWVHRTPQPERKSFETEEAFRTAWQDYARPINLHPLFGEDERILLED